MNPIREGNLIFLFPSHWQASKYDDWTYYQKHFRQIVSRTKAVDILAIDPHKTAWLIEVKDYRRHRRSKKTPLPNEIAQKVKDSLAGMASASFNANVLTEKTQAQAMFKCPEIRVVPHLEQPNKKSRLFPRAFDPANIQKKLKQLVKSVDPHPKVVECQNMQNLPWTVT